MTDEAKRLVAALREDAEWAQANEWETPITLSDDLALAADLIEKLALDRNKWKNQAKAAEYDMHRAIMDTVSACDICKYSGQEETPCSVCNCVSHWHWRGPCAEDGEEYEENGGADDGRCQAD